MKGKFFANVVLVVGVLAVCFAALEAFTRLYLDDGLLYELEMWKYAREVKERDYNPEIGHRHRANAHAQLMNVDVRTDENGFRTPSIPLQAPPGVARIAFVGDSVTMGWGVAEQETFARQVLDTLKKQGRKVDGFNLGVGNWNTRQELGAYKAYGAKFKPDIIALVYFINDGEPMPTYTETSWLSLHSAAWVVLNYRIDSLLRSFSEAPDWKKYYRDLYNPDADGWKKTREALAGFATLAKDSGVKLIVFHIPELHELKPYPFQDVTDKVRGVVEGTGTPFYDLLPIVENMEPSTLWVTVPDPHPNGKAEIAFAKGMLPPIVEALDNLCKTEQKGC
ncbi:MAG: SGNH/GDSL hydrolase family protein [Reyranella sp.]|jgi:hypothetical protein|uniref:SGNH/GDSL hydrolase family protein n=1 Tax=Reyranella sp. TaxID=1929291 RepID=UPI0025CC966B|nr:SGNH/GDSL hydrolase family protein [Reyranella sp.]MBR2813618.1 SGNH/GDSL hydrolase family protein [Reyranella sp.]